MGNIVGCTNILMMRSLPAFCLAGAIVLPFVLESYDKVPDKVSDKVPDNGGCRI